MLYSENLERENRFILSLKIAIPVMGMFAVFFFFFTINLKKKGVNEVDHKKHGKLG